MVNLS